jgi:hypothetical protein
MADADAENNEPISNRRSAMCAGKVTFNVDLRIDTTEMRGWPPERIKALFDGIALVQSAMAGNVEE